MTGGARWRSWPALSALYAVVMLAALGPNVWRRSGVVPGEPGAHATDFTCYTTAGAAFFGPGDPYLVENPAGLRYLYPPLFALTVAPLAGLDTRVQALLWLVLSIGFTLLAAGECRRLAALAGGLPRFIATAGLLTVFHHLTACYRCGQVGVLLVWLMLLAFRLARHGETCWRRLAGGLLLGLAAVIKITPALPALVLVMMLAVSPAERVRGARPVAIGLAAGVALFLLVIPGLVLGWQANLDHLASWRREVVDSDQLRSVITFPDNESLENSLRLVFTGGRSDRLPTLGPGGYLEPAGPLLAPVVNVIRAVMLLALVAAALALGRADSAVAHGAGFGLALSAALLLPPLTGIHMHVLLLPAVLYVPWWLVRSGRPRAAAWAAHVPWILAWVSEAWWKQYGVLGLGLSLWQIAVCGYLWRHPGREDQ